MLNDVALLSGKIAINHGHSGNIHCYVCILCVSGIIELQINGIHVVLEDRSGITLKYASHIDLKNNLCPTTFNGYVLLMSKNYAESITSTPFLPDFYDRQEPQAIKLPADEFDLVKTGIEFIEKIMNMSKDSSCTNVRQITRIVFRLALEKFYLQQNLSDQPSHILANFFNILDTHYKERKTLQFYAEKLGTSTKYLSSLLVRKTGKSFSEIKSQKILLDATDMLLGKETIRTISYELGFGDAGNFCRFFKKQTGMTPHEFRRSKA